jgi:hypothetical protein
MGKDDHAPDEDKANRCDGADHRKDMTWNEKVQDHRDEDYQSREH